MIHLLSNNEVSTANYAPITLRHRRSWEGAALEFDATRCGVRRLTRLPVRRILGWAFFFFLGFTQTWLQSKQTWLQFMPNWVDSARIGPYWPAIETDRNGQNRPKLAWNHVGIVEIGFAWDPNILNLSFLNFILNICCFFCVFFFVLWIKAIVMWFLRIF